MNSGVYTAVNGFVKAVSYIFGAPLQLGPPGYITEGYWAARGSQYIALWVLSILNSKRIQCLTVSYTYTLIFAYVNQGVSKLHQRSQVCCVEVYYQ